MTVQTPTIQKRLAAIEKARLDGNICSVCHGSGTIRYWSEVAYFEDLRACLECDAGRSIDSKIADLVKRDQFEQNFSKR